VRCCTATRRSRSRGWCRRFGMRRRNVSAVGVWACPTKPWRSTACRRLRNHTFSLATLRRYCP
jgi:hypothetical protein